MYKILVLMALLAVFGSCAWMSVNGLAAVYTTLPVILVAGAGVEAGKVLCVIYLRRHWALLRLPGKAFYVCVIAALSLITSTEVLGYLVQCHEAETRSLQVAREQIKALAEEEDILQQRLRTIDETLSGLPESYVTKRIRERRAAGYDEIVHRLGEIAKRKGDLRLARAKDSAWSTPVVASARLVGISREQAIKWFTFFFVLVLEPLSIGLAVSVSRLYQSADPLLDGSSVAVPAGTGSSMGSSPDQKTHQPPAGEPSPNNNDLRRLRSEYNLSIKDIARVTGKKHVSTVARWLADERTIPEQTLNVLRSHLKNP